MALCHWNYGSDFTGLAALTHRNIQVILTYEDLFAKFAENYWNLVVKYDLRQMRKDGKLMYSRIEKILMSHIEKNPILRTLEFNAIEKVEKESIVKQVTKECKSCVLGALYEDFDGVIYSFDLKGTGIVLNNSVYEFMLKHKTELERLNYYSWAKFLEQVNDDDDALIRIIEKT